MRADRLRLAMAALAVLGLGIAGYLTYVHYRGLHVACLAGGGGCEQVQASRYATFAGVPVAAIGLAGYAAILATTAIGGETARLGVVLLSVVGAGFSGYLTYRELFTIHAICQWCVASAIVMTVLAGLAIADFLRAPARQPCRAGRLGPSRTRADGLRL